MLNVAVETNGDENLLIRRIALIYGIECLLIAMQCNNKCRLSIHSKQFDAI